MPNFGFELDQEEVSLNLRSLNRYSLTLKLIKLIDVGYLIFDLEEGVEFGIEVEKFDPEEAKFDIEEFNVLPEETEIDLEEAESDIKDALFDLEQVKFDVEYLHFDFDAPHHHTTSFTFPFYLRQMTVSQEDLQPLFVQVVMVAKEEPEDEPVASDSEPQVFLNANRPLHITFFSLCRRPFEQLLVVRLPLFGAIVQKYIQLS